jgi:hypothetical protein|tara:strand:+ start:206 stop:883 length:678 start_codon:yes stop_codon:yes gene_type:complete
VIGQNVNRILEELPDGVQLVAAAKSVQPREILEAVEAGITIIGENYVQEAEKAYRELGSRVQWHLIGHLQKNKVKKAVGLFDMITTLDSVELAAEINKRCAQIDKVMSVLIEVNSGREEQKKGVSPEKVEPLIRDITGHQNLKVMGLMTMGPASGNPEDSRPCFAETRKVFDLIKQLDLPGVEMRYLSMGMTNSYLIAVEEGANMVRIGTAIFGPRNYSTAGAVG